MAHVIVIATGGTIASRSTKPGAGKIAVTAAAALVESVSDGRVPPGITVEARDAGTMNSYNLTLADARRIVAAISSALDSKADGIVVTHGTDTLEETGFLYDLVSSDPRPVIFTGAQQSSDTTGGGDGPGNIADAITVAANPASRCRGAMAVFSGCIFAVRGVRKVNTFAAQPFAPVVGGNIGLVWDGLVQYNSYPEPWRRLECLSAAFDSLRIATVVNQPGLSNGDGDIESALQRGASGIVVLGTGAGNTSKSLVSGIEAAAAAQVPVILATRLPFGHITPTYGDGGAVDAVAAGAVPIWSLPFTQARLLLATLLDQVGSAQIPHDLATFDRKIGRWSPV
ncbi:MAG: asparaginase domain-containing protein [Propionibacteriaceae bacterium]|nr:asparaginase domain-containing protein [Propionibacteriaceae bacterium]